MPAGRAHWCVCGQMPENEAEEICMRNHKKALRYVLLGLVVAALAFAYYYVELPAINIHEAGFWWFLLLVAAVAVFVFCAMPVLRKAARNGAEPDLKHDKPTRVGVIVVGAIAAVFLVGGILSSTVVNAKKYQQMLTVQTRNFAKDIKEIQMDDIPILDKASATLLGNREMGSMADMVSQFEVADDYSQINLHDKPVRVSPLQYANLIKWLTNQSEGIPAYMQIDMATQDTKLVKLEQPIRYSKSEHFGRYLYRHLRFRYPTYIFDNANFEIDENGTPWWICPVKDYTIGLFGGETIGRVVLCNAQTGETQDLAVKDVPQWVDKVYSAEMLINFYNYYGTLKHGFFNSVLGQKDCLETTDGYNYIAMDDDVWVYTGVTSVTSDQSIVGFVLMNQRTKETRFYSMDGAVESSAMRSAEGQVQNLGYQSTSPLLLNISNQPTYFVALKDDAGLVKKYAMVNVQKYQIVALGDTVAACGENYKKLMATNGIRTPEAEKQKPQTAAGKIAKIAQVVRDGNSHAIVLLEGDTRLYDVDLSKHIGFLRKNAGDAVRFTYTPGEPLSTVTKVD